RQCRDPVAVAHPDIQHGAAVGVAAVFDIIEQLRRALDRHFRIAEFALGGGGYAPPQLLRHGLHAVTFTEKRNTESKHRWRCLGRLGIGHGLRATREDYAARLEATNLIVRYVPRMYLAIHTQ